jgi:hypothetical protein
MFISQPNLARHRGVAETLHPIHHFPATITANHRRLQADWLANRHGVWRPIGELVAEIVFGLGGER